MNVRDRGVVESSACQWEPPPPGKMTKMCTTEFVPVQLPGSHFSTQ